jgi:Fe-S oxidoreductase
MPEVVNAITQTPGLSWLAKLAGGIDRRRSLPRFAPITLQEWFVGRGGSANAHRPNSPGRRVVLFPDIFNNYLHTDVGVACVEAIEAAGWQVIMPDVHVCCGRPLYDYGFLDVARRYLHRVLDVLQEEIRAGTPVVGMEPSCVAVFKDELGKLLPHDDDADRLRRNVYHFAGFFTAFDIEPPPLHRNALVWGHCHHRATGGMSPEHEVLTRMGLAAQPLQGGCCGLAGSWGFEEGKYDISLECGEQALLPAVRSAARDTVIVADGFSCKTQIEQAGTGRGALHVAQVMKMAREHGPDGPRFGLPEQPYNHLRPKPGLARRARRLAPVGASLAALGAAAAFWLRSARR